MVTRLQKTFPLPYSCLQDALPCANVPHIGAVREAPSASNYEATASMASSLNTPLHVMSSGSCYEYCNSNLVRGVRQIGFAAACLEGAPHARAPGTVPQHAGVSDPASHSD